MDLSKVFDCIPHGLLIAKMEAYGFSEDFLTFLYSYLERRKQSISPQCITNSNLRCPTRIHSRTILFNIFMNDLFYFMKDAQLLNYADDKTTATFSNIADKLQAKTSSSIVKDTYREKARSNRAPALTKITNMGIWVVDTTN